jgi:hypothetical protein
VLPAKGLTPSVPGIASPGVLAGVDGVCAKVMAGPHNRNEAFRNVRPRL